MTYKYIQNMDNVSTYIQQTMVANGFSLHDSYTSGDNTNLVYTLPGTPYNEYVLFSIGSSDLTVGHYYYWDQSTHSGIVPTTNNISPPFYLIVAENNLAIVNPTDYTFLVVAKITFTMRVIKTITQSASPGSIVKLYLDDTSGIATGSYWGITTGSSYGRTQVYVVSVDSEGIVVQALNMSVPAGAKLTNLICNYSVNYGASSFMPYSTSIPTPPTSSWNYGSIIYDIDVLYSIPVMMPIKYGISGEGTLFILRGFTYTIHSDSSKDIYTAGTIDEGAISSFSSSSITDNTKNWAQNSLVGYKLVIPTTKDAKTIIANTSTSITVNDELFPGISTGMQYYISERAFLRVYAYYFVRVA